MLGLVNRLQNYLREKALFDGRERVQNPPFTLFFNPSSTDPQEGIAIPDEAEGYTPADVSRVCAAFAERGRVPCVQYLDVFAPRLTIMLQLGQYPISLAPETPPPGPLPVADLRSVGLAGSQVSLRRRCYRHPLILRGSIP